MLRECGDLRNPAWNYASARLFVANTILLRNLFALDINSRASRQCRVERHSMPFHQYGGVYGLARGRMTWAGTATAATAVVAATGTTMAAARRTGIAAVSSGRANCEVRKRAMRVCVRFQVGDVQVVRSGTISSRVQLGQLGDEQVGMRMRYDVVAGRAQHVGGRLERGGVLDRLEAVAQHEFDRHARKFRLASARIES